MQRVESGNAKKKTFYMSMTEESGVREEYTYRPLPEEVLFSRFTFLLLSRLIYILLSWYLAIISY